MTDRYRIGVDIGGTFTDLVLFDEQTRTVRTAKVSSTPSDYASGVVSGVRGLVGDDLTDVGFLVHGTTAGLNAFLQRRGARCALVATNGFGDVYLIGRASRPDMYNLFYKKPAPLVLRRDTFEVPGRMLADGTVLAPLRDADLQPLVRSLRERDYTAVAVCLLHAYANPAHELLVRDVVQCALPHLSVSLSHEVAREWREYERTSSTVLNAYITPIMESYLGSLEATLVEHGFPDSRQLHIMRSNGGLMTAMSAKRRAVHTLFSGPVGAAIGTQRLSATLDEGNLICIDMGGTSFDVSLVLNGEAAETMEASLEGFPVLAPMVQVHSIGAGGGSVAWSEAGELRVGPRSAGAEPGPACYGRGGTEPTVTDANLFLGRIDPHQFLGGRMRLDSAAARRALESLAAELGLDTLALAEGILRVANAAMANAIRAVTVARGIDPRDFALVAIGGAGPMHAADLAAELDIDRVIVPFSPGTFSAWGMLHADIQHDVVATFIRGVSEAAPGDIEATFQRLESEARAILQEEHVAPDRVQLLRSADMRYVGQEYFLNLNVPIGETMQNLLTHFHESYQRRYGHSSPRAPVELVNLRVRAIGVVEKVDVPAPRNAVHDTGVPCRPTRFGNEWWDTAVYVRESLATGQKIQSPAIVEEASCTIVVPPAFSGSVDAHGNLVLTRQSEVGPWTR